MPAHEFRRGDRVIVVHERDDEHVPAGGPQYVLVHGLGMAHEYWDDLAVRLASSGRVLALDLPGFGDAPRPGRPLSIRETAELLAELIRSELLDRPVLVGHSTGAQVVAETVARHPLLVDRIVLIGPSVNPRERTLVQQTARFVQDVAIIDPEAFHLGIRAYAETGFAWVLANLRPMLAHRMERVLPKVRADALVIRGADDRVVPRYWAQSVAALAPNTSYVEVPDRGHEATASRNGELADLVIAHANGKTVGSRLAPYERRAALSRSLGGGRSVRVGWVLRDYGFGAKRRLAELMLRHPPLRWRRGDPRLPAIVLLPGVHETWGYLAPLADSLNRAGYRVTTVHGLRMNRRSVAGTSRRLQRALAKVAAPPAGRLIVAHSKGGLIGKHLLLDLERGSGPLGADGADALDVRGVVTLATPFAGSSRARWFVDPSMRAFLPTDQTIVELQEAAAVNARIVSIFGTLDAQVPEGSVLAGATNVIVPAAGHFRLTGSAAAHRAVIDGIRQLTATSTTHRDESPR